MHCKKIFKYTFYKQQVCGQLFLRSAKVLNTFRTRSSSMKQQQKSFAVNLCNIAKQKPTIVPDFHSLSYTF